MPAGRDYWAFGRPDDPFEETPDSVPPGYTQARSIPYGAGYGKQLVCRSCGALVAATVEWVDQHDRFHIVLSAATLSSEFARDFSPGNTPADREALLDQRGYVNDGIYDPAVGPLMELSSYERLRRTAVEENERQNRPGRPGATG